MLEQTDEWTDGRPTDAQTLLHTVCWQYNDQFSIAELILTL